MTEEELQLLKENNIMLKVLCRYIAEKDKNNLSDDLKNLLSNLVSNLYISQMFNAR